ncbi:MAG: tetratricopeptide repeat protein [Myxococcales bacterium]|nr:tetratricopeptide repeat protein [Myxococcales bacterium]
MEHPGESALSAYAENRLEPPEREALRAHLAGCDRCRLLLDQLSDVGQANTLVARNAAETIKERPQTRPDSPRSREVQALLGKGTSLGRYVLLDRLGGGGMGEVFAAYDPQLDRKVALKLLRPGLLGADEGRARLLREAQAMARLQHPNVIAVHDVGTFEDRVFVAMEFVEGDTLSDWLREQRPWQKVLEIFLAAGRGLAAAHSAGLVHRDFKPDNVLIGTDGRPRVLDFGLARQAAQLDPAAPQSPSQVDLDRPITQSALESPITQVGAIMGTPGYMSPEQLHGQPTDARTDQFSFCVALYESLYSRRPFEGNTLGSLAASIVAQRIPEPPRESPVPRWILEVLKRGLSSAADARYPSMVALLAALSRDPRRGRTRLLAFAAALMVGVSGVAYGLLARTQLSPCGGTDKRLAGIWDDARKQEIRESFSLTRKPYASDAFLGVERALDEYTRGWLALSVDTCEAALVRRTDSDETYALKTLCLEGRLKEVSALAALFAEADEEVVSNAVSAARALDDLRGCTDVVALAARPIVQDPSVRQKVEQVRARLIEAKALNDAGKYTRGAEVARKALEQARPLGHRALEAEAHLLLGRLLDRSGDAKGAEASLFEAAVAAEASRSDEVAVRALSRLVSVVGYVQARHAEAHTWSRLAVAAMERLGKNDEIEADLHSDLGNLALAEARYEDAQRSFEKALALREKALGPEHPEVARTHNNLGVALARLSKLSEAARHYERSLEIHRKMLGPSHPDLANSMNNLGVIHAKLGNLQAALERYREALRIREMMLGPDHPDVAGSLQAIGNLYPRMGKHTEALELHRRALGIRLKAFGEGHPNVAESYGNLAQTLLSLHRWEESLDYARKALAIYEKVLGTNHPSTATAHEYVGLALQGMRQYDRAKLELERALEARKKALGPSHTAVARSYKHLGDLMLLRSRPEKALSHFQTALAIRERAVGADAATVDFDLVGIGRSYMAMKGYQQAVPYLERALAIREKSDEVLLLAEVRFDLGRALFGAGGDRERALFLASQAAETFSKRGEKSAVQLGWVKAWLAQACASSPGSAHCAPPANP